MSGAGGGWTAGLGSLWRGVEEGVDAMVSRSVHTLTRAAASAGSTPAGAASTDARLLASVEEFLGRGRDLLRWWQVALPANRFAERFGLGRTFNDPPRSFGFFDQARVGGRQRPVMGNYQKMFYDQPKTPPANRQVGAEWMRDQVREFVLHYFMRVSDTQAPEAYIEGVPTAAPGLLRPLSWCPDETPIRGGFGFRQLYYKPVGGGEVCPFPEADRFAVVDLRDIGVKYEWIVLQVEIFAFNVTFAPFGAAGPQFQLPLAENSYLVVSRDFVVDEEAPKPGVLGRYGFGYAFIKNPETGLLAFGPGEFDEAIELIVFEVFDNGQVCVDMSFVSNRPERVVNVSLDPVTLGYRAADLMSFGLTSRLLAPLKELWDRLPQDLTQPDPVFTYITLANLATAGWAGERLCISRQQLEKEFLAKHFMQHYQTIVGSLPTWRGVCDWLDAASLPEWVRRGRSEVKGGPGTGVVT